MNNRMSIEALKDLAKKCEAAYRLNHVDGRAIVNNPLCGDQILLELQIVNHRIVDVGHDVSGCLLCKAATGLLGNLIIETNISELNNLDHNIDQGLQNKALQLNVNGPLLALLCSVRSYPSRHSCIKLPFQAAVAAANQYLEEQ